MVSAEGKGKLERVPWPSGLTQRTAANSIMSEGCVLMISVRGPETTFDESSIYR